MFVNLRLRSAVAVWLGLPLFALASSGSLAGTRVEVAYTVIYLHVTIGSGRWALDVRNDRYVATASGEVKGMMSLLINGQGSGRSEGVIAHGNASPARFAAHVISTGESDDIDVAFQNGAVTELHALPPFPPVPKRLVLTRDVLENVRDPLSAAIIFTENPNEAAPSLCDRRLRIFDGRRRFDVALSFKRTDDVSLPPTYRGTGIVCGARLFPIAGHQVGSSALKYLVESKDLEIEYVLAPEARAFLPVAATFPTLIGTVYVNAT